MKYKISDLAKILGVTSMTLRRYEKNGYLTPERDDSDYRWYTQQDIIKTAQIRILRKCGFTHSEIEEMFGNTSDNILDIAQKKLNEIDEEMRRQKHMRHWLKDNIQLMKTLKTIGTGFVLMECPPVRYVIYSEGEKLFTEKERLKTIEDFMYRSEEVQHMCLYKYEDTQKNIFIPHSGWAIKEMDIERLDLYDIMKNDRFIEVYPQQLCMYGVISFPVQCLENIEKQRAYIDDFGTRRDEFMQKNGFKCSGDTMMFNVNTIGTTADALVCIPVEKI